MADDVDAADRKLDTPTEFDDSPAQDRQGNGVADGGLGSDATKPDAPAVRGTGIRLTVAVGLVAIAALATVGGWLGVSAHRAHHSEQQRALFLRVGRQGALNLTTMSFTDVDAAVQRILDSSTGAFHDDFQQRSGPFVEVVKQTQSTTEGMVTEAGLESAQDDQAKVLVAVSVKTTSPAQPAQQLHLWRMRITVNKVGDGAKMSDVAFVP